MICLTIKQTSDRSTRLQRSILNHDWCPTLRAGFSTVGEELNDETAQTKIIVGPLGIVFSSKILTCLCPFPYCKQFNFDLYHPVHSIVMQHWLKWP